MAAIRLGLATTLAAAALTSCARIGYLNYVPETVAPMLADSTEREGLIHGMSTVPLGPMFGDTLIGLMPGTADSSRRYLGRLRNGYTADTLNIFLLGDNRPGHRTTRLGAEYLAMRGIFSLNPARILRGLLAIPVALARGLYPDLALLRDIPGRLRNMPTWGAEHHVVGAMLAKADSLNARGEIVAAVINTGDLVTDGRRPKHWERFLRLNQPLTSRVPYFPVAGNHERTDAVEGIANWRTATGLPVGGDRLYYCFDSADGWVRFIALDSNPMADPTHLWSRDVQIKYSAEEIAWMTARIKEHNGPAFVFMHHPPFSVAWHRDEWQADSLLRNRREQMMTALHEAGIGILANGHEHAYERALFTWPDAVLIVLVTGGGGSPLHTLPPPAESARMFSEYRVAGSTVDPDNVVTGTFNHFIHVRMWFGGGEFYTYAVDNKSRPTLADKASIDLSRYGIPKIDEHKVPILPKAPSTTGPHEEGETPGPGTADTTRTSKRILNAPSPRNATRPQVTSPGTVRDTRAPARPDTAAAPRRKSAANARRDSLETARLDKAAAARRKSAATARRDSLTSTKRDSVAAAKPDSLVSR